VCFETQMDKNQGMRHTVLFGELQRLPVGKSNFCEILSWLPSRSKLLARFLVVFPINLILDLSSRNAFSEDGADLVKRFFVKFAVGMGRRSYNRS